MEDIIDFSKDEKWHNIAYSNPSSEDLKEFENFLKNNKEKIVRLYHGTSYRNNVLEEGLKPTSKTRKRSIQSTIGYVYLSIYPGMAKFFGEMAYPQDEIIVYSVELPISKLLCDKDQLFNKRLYGSMDIKDTLANSIAYGHGARVRGKIDSQLISKIDK